MPLGENIKQARIMAKMSQEELAQKLGYKSRSTIAKIESGENDLTQKKVAAFAKALNVSIDFLMDGNGNENNSQGVRIPVLGTIVAGIPITAVENIIDYEEISQEMAKTGEYFALVVKGSSMEPKIYEGDVVIVKKQSTVDNGDIAIVLVNGNEATIKQIQRSQSGITLVGFNVAVYPPHIYTNEEIEDLPVNVIGKAVEVRRKL
ncbi:LexA family transcriptional regulator [uncultured Dialister sp.]|uniref:LexA family protein n=1 Tax=uncultured Dialister sp. TaxID=278064 RepID=UPI0026DEBC34|nr:S24 family peptidase [uncultured Dialister sp.]